MPYEDVKFGDATAHAWWLYQSTTDENGVGTKRYSADGTKRYKWVQLLQTASQAGVAGDVVVYVTLTGGNTVVSTDASADGGSVPIGAGLLVGAITAAQGTAGVFLWIQIEGLATISNAVSGGAAGKAITASATDKLAVLRANAYDVPLAVMINTTTSINLLAGDL